MISSPVLFVHMQEDVIEHFGVRSARVGSREGALSPFKMAIVLELSTSFTLVALSES